MSRVTDAIAVLFGFKEAVVNKPDFDDNFDWDKELTKEQAEYVRGHFGLPVQAGKSINHCWAEYNEDKELTKEDAKKSVDAASYDEVLNLGEENDYH